MTFHRICDTISFVIKHIYTDGGVIWDGNPGGSKLGGTWAYVLTDENDELVSSDYGTLKLDDRPTTNNHTELFAAIQGLKAVPDKWVGVFCSDSEITLGRMFRGWKFKNVPQFLIDDLRAQLCRVGNLIPRHVGGHPTKKQLEKGYNRRGNETSKWNKVCDDLCNQAKIQNIVED